MEIKKEIEKLILEHLDKSESFWTDLYPFIEHSEYSYHQFYEILTELINEDYIKADNENSINFLNTTVKGKLATKSEFLFKITTKGKIRLIDNSKRLYNEPWIGYLIALISLSFLVYQHYENKELKSRVETLEKNYRFLNPKLDSLNREYMFLNSQYDSLRNQVEIHNDYYYDLELNIDKQK